MIYHKAFKHSISSTWVVFVHGAGGSNVIWFRQLKDFKKHFNVLLVDLRGHGKSQVLSANDGEYRFTEVANDVVQIMNHLQIEKAHFVGISLGCIVIRAIDKLVPGRAESIILGGAIIQFNKRIKALVTVGKLMNTILPYMWLYKLNAWILIPSRKHAASRKIFIQEAVKLGEREFKRWLKMSKEIKYSLNDYINKEASAPVLYLMGDRDHMFLPMVAKLVKNHINSKLEVIRNSGHVCNLDQPDLFNQLSILFIQEVQRQKEKLFAGSLMPHQG